ncbi:MAG: CoA ester lyase [Pseudomonadota bacterium]|nr:CoA ester lyase [Pseudomonadota bacterium]
MQDLSDITAPLFVPGNKPERFSKAVASGADAVILDLEDAVEPEEKDRARSLVTTDFTDRPVIVRINGSDTPWHAADLAAMRRLRPSAVMLPKAEDPSVLTHIAEVLGQSTPLLALIETARGIANARELAAHPSVARLVFGSIDFCVDMGCSHTRLALQPPRFELVLASRLAGCLAPIDGVTSNIADPKVTHDDALHARELGLTAKLCIHPRQVPEVFSAFGPTAAEIAWAQEVLAAGDGAHAVAGEMVDAPVRKRALAVLKQVR